VTPDLTDARTADRLLTNLDGTAPSTTKTPASRPQQVPREANLSQGHQHLVSSANWHSTPVCPPPPAQHKEPSLTPTSCPSGPHSTPPPPDLSTPHSMLTCDYSHSPRKGSPQAHGHRSNTSSQVSKLTSSSSGARQAMTIARRHIIMHRPHAACERQLITTSQKPSTCEIPTGH